MGRRIGIVLLLSCIFSGLFLPTASAYVDPGSGSFIFQALIGGLLAAGVALKVFWKRIASVFSRKREGEDGA